MNVRMSLWNRSVRSLAVGVVALALCGVTRTANAQIAYTIGSTNGITSLLRFDLTTPGAVSNVGQFTLGGVGVGIDAIDFRPLNNALYAYSDATDSLYLVDVLTGGLTVVSTSNGVPTNTNLLGMDFNPTIDRVRIVTDSTQNLVYNPNANAAPVNATPLFYAAGDPGAAFTTRPLRVVENAYTNNTAGGFTTTVQYAIDVELDSLVTLANNAGTLTTVNGVVGNLGVDVNDVIGFDIFTNPGGTNFAYALFNGDSNPTLYSINLATGAATPYSAVGTAGNQAVYSLAVTPGPAIAPEPGTFVLLGAAGLTMLGVCVRRNRTLLPSA